MFVDMCLQTIVIPGCHAFKPLVFCVSVGVACSTVESLESLQQTLPVTSHATENVKKKAVFEGLNNALRGRCAVFFPLSPYLRTKRL